MNMKKLKTVSDLDIFTPAVVNARTSHKCTFDSLIRASFSLWSVQNSTNAGLLDANNEGTQSEKQQHHHPRRCQDSRPAAIASGCHVLVAHPVVLADGTARLGGLGLRGLGRRSLWPTAHIICGREKRVWVKLSLKMWYYVRYISIR